MMTSTFATPAKKSWAAIVKTGTVAELSSPKSIVATSKPPPLHPSPRGAKESVCHGRVLVMLGHYGWILPLDDIDHRDAAKNGGRIYIHKRDVMDDQTLAEGDLVSFYLYIDDQGLGAEECRIESTTGTTKKPNTFTKMNATAVEFVPGAANTTSQCVVPKTSGDFSDCKPSFEPTTFRMNPNAIEFAPRGFGSSYTVAPHAQNYSNLLLINPAFLDDSDDENDAAGHTEKGLCYMKSDMKSVLAEQNCSSDDDLDASLNFGLPLKKRQNSESDDSTSAGVVSDSEGECLSLPPGLSPPPGLSLPPGFRPPPGLC